MDIKKRLYVRQKLTFKNLTAHNPMQNTIILRFIALHIPYRNPFIHQHHN